MLIPLPSLLSKYRIQVRGVIHVGAHHGGEYPAYKEAGLNPIALIEPLPSNFAILEKTVGPECLLFNTALGNQEGEVDFHVESDNMGQSCSVLKPGKHLEQYPGIKFTGVIKVPITRLDSLRLEPGCYNFLNMDVQGFELEVLKGGEKTLKDIECVYTEVNRDEVYIGCARVEELDSFLKQRGFRRVKTDWAGGTWGDAVYLRRH